MYLKTSSETVGFMLDADKKLKQLLSQFFMYTSSPEPLLYHPNTAQSFANISSIFKHEYKRLIIVNISVFVFDLSLLTVTIRPFKTLKD